MLIRFLTLAFVLITGPSLAATTSPFDVNLDLGDAGVIFVEGVGFRPADGIDHYGSGKIKCPIDGLVWKDIAIDRVVANRRCAEDVAQPLFLTEGLPPEGFDPRGGPLLPRVSGPRITSTNGTSSNGSGTPTGSGSSSGVPLFGTLTPSTPLDVFLPETTTPETTPPETTPPETPCCTVVADEPPTAPPVAPVPLPATLSLLSAMIAILVAMRWMRAPTSRA